MFLLKIFMDIEVFLNIAFGGTWDDVTRWDDVVPLERRQMNGELISRGESIDKCRHLGNRDTCFVYCKARAIQSVVAGIYEFTKEPSFNSVEYQSQIDPYSLQLWCLDPDNRSNCIFYKWAEENEIIE